MNAIYKYLIQFKTPIFYSLGIIICAFGAYFASVTVDKYKYIVDGVLGFTNLFLVYLVFLSPKRIISSSTNKDLRLPKDLQLLPFGFFMTVIIYWAGIQLIDLFWYLRHIILN
jgi:hypothetical protein